MTSGHEDLEAFGRAVRERRLQAGLSQDAAARKWGISRTWLSDLERGRANPTFDALLALARNMGVSLESLFRRTDQLRGE